MELLLFAIGLVILGYLGFVLLFPKAIPEDNASRTRQALKELMASSAQDGVSAKTSFDFILKEEFQEESSLVRIFYSLPLMKVLYTKQMQSGHQKSALGTIFVLIALFFLIAAGINFLSGNILVSLLVALPLSWVLIYKYYAIKVKKRNNKFLQLFPDVLDMIVRSVRSGFPITTAFKMVAENMESPVKEEFQQVVSEIAAGRSINETLNRLAARINESDINFFVVVLSVQQETGGNLAEVVSNLSGIIRKRKQLRMKIKAMTSEGRATGWVLGGLPVFIFAILYVIRKEYLSPLWTDPLGQIILASSAGLVVFCMWIVNQMIQIDI
jgi:tight adherence protein B